MLAKIVGGVVGTSVAVFGGVTAFGDETERDASGAIVESGGLGVLELRIGDCVQLPGDGVGEVASVEGVPCAEPHDAQVYAELEVSYLAPAGVTPAQGDIEDEAMEGCLARWEGAIGTVYREDLERDLTYLFPTTEGSGSGDHAVNCLVVPLDGVPTTGSI